MYAFSIKADGTFISNVIVLAMVKKNVYNYIVIVYCMNLLE